MLVRRQRTAADPPPGPCKQVLASCRPPRRGRVRPPGHLMSERSRLFTGGLDPPHRSSGQRHPGRRQFVAFAECPCWPGWVQYRADQSRSSPLVSSLVSTADSGMIRFRSLGSPEVGLSEVPLARGWVTCRSASSAWRKLPGPGSARRRCRVRMRPVAGPRRRRRDRWRRRRERRSGQGRVRAPVL